MSIIWFVKRTPVGVAGFLFWVSASTSLALSVKADAYLDALQDAAADIEVDSLTSSPTSDPDIRPGAIQTGTAVSNGAADMPLGLDMVALEQYLQQAHVGSYAFFKRLSDARKQQVFQAYRSRPEIAHIRNQIKQQYLQN